MRPSDYVIAKFVVDGPVLHLTEAFGSGRRRLRRRLVRGTRSSFEESARAAAGAIDKIINTIWRKRWTTIGSTTAKPGVAILPLTPGRIPVIYWIVVDVTVEVEPLRIPATPRDGIGGGKASEAVYIETM